MSPRAANSLLEAISRTQVREDQLTELLACALQTDEAFRRLVLAEVNVPGFERAEVCTQVRLTRRRVDMELRLLGSGVSRHRVWIEVKTGAVEQTEQLRDYAAELEQLPGHGTLIALGPSNDHKLWESAEKPCWDNAPTAQKLTWQKVIQALDAAGQERGGVAWRERATDAQASALQHVTLELYRHLAREQWRLNIMPDEPLQVTDSLVVSRAGTVLDKGGVIDALLSLAISELEENELVISERPGHWRAARHRGVTVTSATSRIPPWAPELNAGGDSPAMVLWFQASDADDRPGEPRNQPIFLASLVMNEPTPQCQEALMNEDWLAPGLPYVTPHRGRISHVRYLAEIATAGITLSAQASALAKWADESFTALSRLSPPPPLSSTGPVVVDPDAAAQGPV